MPCVGAGMGTAAFARIAALEWGTARFSRFLASPFVIVTLI